MQNILRYQTLTDKKIVAMDKTKAVVILPISLLEAHGPHLPLGTDFLIAEELSMALAEKLSEQRLAQPAIVLPVVPLGAGGIQRVGTLNHDELLIEQTIIEFGERLAEYGFGKGVIVSGHGGKKHLKAMSDAADVLQEMGIFNFLPLTSYLFSSKGMDKMKTALRQKSATQSSNNLPLYDGHGGCWETSLALHFFPQWVNAAYRRLPESDDAQKNGYRGNPACANAELGKQLKEFLLMAAMDIITRKWAQ